MKTQTKPMWLKKVWEEIKRPFDQGWRTFNNAMLRYAYRRASRKQLIIGSEQEATERVISNALNNPDFVERLLEKRLSFADAGQDTIQDSWNDFFRNLEPGELEKLRNELTVHTDELSCEVVDYCITRRFYLQEYSAGDLVWKMREMVQRLDPSPSLVQREHEHIELLAEGYVCPYTFPGLSNSHFEHISTHFGLNQFPVEVQKRVAGKDVIDGGGFIGDSAMVFTEYDPRKVYVFEPNPDTIPAMKNIISANEKVLGSRKDRIEIVPFALNRSKGTFTFYSDGLLDAGATTELSNSAKKNAYEVEAISIDEFVQEHSLNVGLIKLDIEGAEYGTILGAKDTITSQKPVLLISIYHNAKDFFEIKPMIESWDLGYQFAIRHFVPCWPVFEYVLMAY